MANTFRMTNESNVTESIETIYTVPSSTTTVIIGIMLSNTLVTDTVKASVQIVSVTQTSTNSGGTNTNETTFLVKNVPVDNSSSLELMAGNKIIMQTGDIIQAQSDAAPGLDIVISYMEIT